ncbi:hypothetical protein CapIbe_001890 [Capra ibex]
MVPAPLPAAVKPALCQRGSSLRLICQRRRALQVGRSRNCFPSLPAFRPWMPGEHRLCAHEDGGIIRSLGSGARRPGRALQLCHCRSEASSGWLQLSELHSPPGRTGTVTVPTPRRCCEQGGRPE